MGHGTLSLFGLFCSVEFCALESSRIAVGGTLSVNRSQNTARVFALKLMDVSSVAVYSVLYASTKIAVVHAHAVQSMVEEPLALPPGCSWNSVVRGVFVVHHARVSTVRRIPTIGRTAPENPSFVLF